MENAEKAESMNKPETAEKAEKPKMTEKPKKSKAEKPLIGRRKNGRQKNKSLQSGNRQFLKRSSKARRHH